MERRGEGGGGKRQGFRGEEGGGRPSSSGSSSGSFSSFPYFPSCFSNYILDEEKYLAYEK